MKTLTKFLAAASIAALSLAAMAAPANATTYISFNGTSAYATFADDSVPNSIFLNAAACAAPGNPCGGYNSVNIGANPLNEPLSLLHAYAIEAKAGAGNAGLTVFITRTGISPGAFGNYKSFDWQFAGTSAASGGFSITYDAFIDTDNGAGAGGLFATSNLLASETATGPGFGANGNTDFAVSGPFALTARFTISSSGKATLSPTAEIAGVVPEPGTWALMIGGFAGAGAMLRRRRSVAATA